MRRCFYGACAIGLGVWEACAVARALPTVTATARKHNHRWYVQAGIVLWTAGLARHLLRGAS